MTEEELDPYFIGIVESIRKYFSAHYDVFEFDNLPAIFRSTILNVAHDEISDLLVEISKKLKELN